MNVVDYRTMAIKKKKASSHYAKRKTKQEWSSLKENKQTNITTELQPFKS
jgi:hypothetical protein